MNDYLIVVDMQNDFINGTLGTPEAESIVPAVKEKIENHIKEKKGPVLFTLDTHEKNYLETVEGKKLPVEHCIIDTDGWKLHPELDEIAKEYNFKTIQKPTFGSSELTEYLSECNKEAPIDSAELIGLCTDICVISNALLIKAFLPELPISVSQKCCAGVTPESHQRALEQMQMCHIDIT